MNIPPMESVKPMNDAEIEAAVRAELPSLLERRQAGERAADAIDRLAAAAHCELVPRGTEP